MVPDCSHIRGASLEPVHEDKQVDLLPLDFLLQAKVLRWDVRPSSMDCVFRQIVREEVTAVVIVIVITAFLVIWAKAIFGLDLL